MSLTDVVQGEVEVSPDPRLPAGRRRGQGAGAVGAAVWALFAAASGLLLTCGIGLVVWAVTPTSIGGPQQSLRAAVAAFAAGNGMTVTIGRSALTLSPLMIMIVAVSLLAGVSGRRSSVIDDRTGELTRAATAAAVYAAAVTTAGVLLGSPGAVAAEQWWRPFLLALVVVGTTVVLRGQAWRSMLLARTPAWFPVAVRLGAVGAAGIVAVGAVTLVVGLVGAFGSATEVERLAAPGPADGFGMALLVIAFLPNAVVAGAGYATGVGFHIGSGAYAPFGSMPVELPAIPLLAAAPDGREASRVGMVLLLLPVVVAVVIGRAGVRRLDSRPERLRAVGAGAGFSGVLVALLAVVAGGGITGGRWTDIGAPPLLLGLVTAAVLGVFGVAVAAAARTSVAPASTSDADLDSAGDAVPADSAGDADIVSGPSDSADSAGGADPVSADADSADPVSAVAAADAVSEDAVPADAVAVSADADADADSASALRSDSVSGSTPVSDSGEAAEVEQDGVAQPDTAPAVGAAVAGEPATYADAELDAAAESASEAVAESDIGIGSANDDSADPDTVTSAEPTTEIDAVGDESTPGSNHAADEAVPEPDPPIAVDADPAADVDVAVDARSEPEPETDPAVGGLAPREEDLLAESSTSTDAALVDQLQPRPHPRQVG